MICTNCGSENRPGVKFCEDCGSAIQQLKAIKKSPAKPAAKKLVCAKCGAENRLGVKFCEDCGTALQQLKAIKKSPAKPAVKKLVCAKCGVKNRPGIAFCEACGESLSEPGRKSLGFKDTWNKLQTAISENPFKIAFYGLAVVCLIAGVFLLVQSTQFAVTKSQARKIADHTIESRYQDFHEVEPNVAYSNFEEDDYATYTYLRVMSGETEDGVEVAFSINVVVHVNRSSGEYEVFENY